METEKMTPRNDSAPTAEKRSASPGEDAFERNDDDGGSSSELRSQLEQAAAGAGVKRRRTMEPKYYAVKSGFKPGVYYRWDDCLEQVKGYKGAVFQSFPTLEEANAFIAGNKSPTPSTSASPGTKFYAVQRGRKPGVYTDWAVAQDQVRGFRGPKYRRFSTWAEADAYVREGQDPEASKPPTVPGMTSERPKDEHGNEYPPGTGPLPPGAEDGFDPNIMLDPTTGKIVYKTEQQRNAIKRLPKEPAGMLNIYTDGSAFKNGRLGARAGVGVYFGPGDNRNVSEPLKGNRQTNQRAELTAILRAVEIAPRHRDVTIFTDSQYAINCVTVWFVNWQRNKWMTANHKPVENRDLIQPIIARIEERTMLNVKTLFEWVRGHNNDPGNEAADQLAKMGAAQIDAGERISRGLAGDLDLEEAIEDEERG
ncbi:hypothetical protein VTO42DRAFT_8376 [Malbranchea cinnamomea]